MSTSPRAGIERGAMVTSQPPCNKVRSGTTLIFTPQRLPAIERARQGSQHFDMQLDGHQNPERTSQAPLGTSSRQVPTNGG